MQNLKYVGKRIGAASTTLSGKPFDNEAFQAFEVRTFKELFRNEVGAAIRQSIGIFHDSVYKDLAPQFGAFETLLAALALHKYEQLEITRASTARDEFLVRVQVRIPVDVSAEDKLFVKADVANSKNYVLASFYIGLCHEFTLLSKKNDLLEGGLQDVVIPGFLTAWRKPDEADGDNAFDPNHANSAKHPWPFPRWSLSARESPYDERVLA